MYNLWHARCFENSTRPHKRKRSLHMEAGVHRPGEGGVSCAVQTCRTFECPGVPGSLDCGAAHAHCLEARGQSRDRFARKRNNPRWRISGAAGLAVANQNAARELIRYLGIGRGLNLFGQGCPCSQPQDCAFRRRLALCICDRGPVKHIGYWPPLADSPADPATCIWNAAWNQAACPMALSRTAAITPSTSLSVGTGKAVLSRLNGQR
jgi:hypothetical protein